MAGVIAIVLVAILAFANFNAVHQVSSGNHGIVITDAVLTVFMSSGLGRLRAHRSFGYGSESRNDHVDGHERVPELS